MNPLTAYGPTSPDAFIGTGPDISAPKNYVGSGANPLTAYGGMSYPESEDAFLGVGPIDLTDPRGDEANVMTNYLTDPPMTDPIDAGLGTSLRPRTRPEGGGEEKDDKGFVEKLKDDVKNFGRSFVKDLQMAADAGFFGGYGAMEKRLLEARNPDGSLKYTP